MASRKVKLFELKVADLKRELEERDLETSGTKSVLQHRLQQALCDVGENPDDFLFDTSDLSKNLANLEANLESKIAESNKSLEANLQAKIDDSNKNLSNLESKIAESNKSLEAKIVESNTKLENKLEEYSGKVSNLENDLCKLGERINEIDDKVNLIEKDLEDRLVSKLRLRLDAPESHTSTSSPSATLTAEPPRYAAPTTDYKPPAPVATVNPHSTVPVFDGKTPWEDYMTLFETAAVVHGWSEETKASVLCLSLRGDALAVLQATPMSERTNFTELVKRLEMRFGHRHMDQLYRSQLRNRTQRPNESLQEFEADIARLVRSAYPSVSDDVYESLAVDKFLDGLRDPETQQAVKLARPKTLSDALTQALEFEAVKQSVRGSARVHVAEAEPTTPPDIQELVVEKVLEALKTRRRKVRSWNCGQLKNPRSKCAAATLKMKQEEHVALVSRVTAVDEAWESKELKKDQQEDPDLKHLLTWKLANNGRPSWQDVAPLSKDVKTYWAQWDSILVDNGMLKREIQSLEGDRKKLQLIVPKKRVPEVLREFHDGVSGGHLGVS